MIRLSCALALALTVSTGCAGSEDGVEPIVSDEVIEQVWMQTPDVAAMPGGVMQLADDEFRLGVITVDDDVAQLELLHRDQPELDRVVKVREGSVFMTLDYEVMVGTVADDLVVVSWRDAEES